MEKIGKTNRQKALEALRDAEYFIHQMAMEDSKSSGSWLGHDRLQPVAKTVAAARELVKLL